MHTHALVRNANVLITPQEERNRKGNTKIFARAEINGKYQYDFSPDSRISKALSLMSAEDLSQRMTGGQYFFVDGKLMDFRDGNYGGFVHSDESIQQLINIIGFLDTAGMGRSKPFKKSNTLSSGLMLGNIWYDDEETKTERQIIVPGYAADGGKFTSRMAFRWNPFVKNVESLFQIIRLICENGMVGLASLCNTRIPLINRWEEHLDIAYKQIQNKVEAIATQRFRQMATERASVEEVTQLYRHAEHRVKGANKEGRLTEAEKLARISKICNPVVHLGTVYNESVFRDQRLAAQHPAHLTTFDAYNMATEIRSHTVENDESTDHALDRFSNRILFERKDLASYAQRESQVRLSAFSNPDEAFFGLVH
jgi:hypothetical protein